MIDLGDFLTFLFVPAEGSVKLSEVLILIFDFICNDLELRLNFLGFDSFLNFWVFLSISDILVVNNVVIFLYFLV